MKTKEIEVVKNDDGTVTVEATSPDEALAAIHAALGHDTKILTAQRESRGGVGGFFATETFVVRAEVESKPQVDSSKVDEKFAGLGELLARVESSTEHGDANFGEVLRKELGERQLVEDRSTPEADSTAVIDLRDAPPSVEERQAAIVEARRRRAARTERLSKLRERQQAEAVTSAVSAPPVQRHEPTDLQSPATLEVAATEDEPSTPSWLPDNSKNKPLRKRSDQAARIGHPSGAVAGTGRVVWSLDALAYLGLPFSILQDMVGLAPEDDMAWIESLAAQLSRYCRPLPLKESVYIGPRSGSLAPLLGVPGVIFPDSPPYGGSVCLRMDDDGAHRAWLSRVKGDRALHLVIGGSSWGDLLTKQPVAISYVGEPDLIITALKLCVKYDIGLGYAVTPPGSFRLNPLDAALAIRSLLGRA